MRPRPARRSTPPASHFGKLDALINIAGGFAFETVADGDPRTWQRMYALNVMTALNASRAAIPHLVSSGAGRIVNIGAMGALQAGSGMGAYAASKAGVHRLTEALAAELKGKITVNAVLPSIIDTAANRASMPESRFHQMGDAEGVGRRDPVPRQRRRERRHRRAAAGEREGLALDLHQLSQHRLEADAALAGERGGFAFRALAVIRAGKSRCRLHGRRTAAGRPLPPYVRG
jgi:NAD(P)-dependent dehydrogenase (short-subunit alcohol dehydrogenase family)